MITKATFKFLSDLDKHNDRDWFKAHKAEYERAKNEFQNFAFDVIEDFAKYDKGIAKDIDGATKFFRIHRDVRFSKDKTPYNVHLSASFSLGGPKSGNAGYYFMIKNGESGMGGGMWHAESAVLNRVRQKISNKLPEFEKILSNSAFKKTYKTLSENNDDLKRVPRGFDSEDPASEYLKRRHFTSFTSLTNAEITSPKTQKKVVDAFKAIKPLIDFLNE